MKQIEAFVSLEAISFKFKEQTVIENVNLSLKKGLSYALVGKSGVGKSTLLNLISGFWIRVVGILINGKSSNQTSDGIAFLFQDLGLFPMANGV